MKVTCIDDSPGVNTGQKPPFKFGEILTAYSINSFAVQILEYPYSLVTGNQKSWNKSRFVPLSDIDETEFERNYQKQTA